MLLLSPVSKKNSKQNKRVQNSSGLQFYLPNSKGFDISISSGIIVMESMGQYLRRARKEKGLDFEDVVLRTRINPVYVKALEEDNLEGLPNLVFAKGFLRAYLQILSINEKAVWERYSASIQEYFSVPEESSVSPEAQLPWIGLRLKEFGLNRLSGYGGLLIVIFLLSFFTVLKIHGGFLNSAPAPQIVASPEPVPIPSVALSFLNPSKEKSEQRQNALIKDDKKNLHVTGEPADEKLNDFMVNIPLDQASGEDPQSLFIEALEQSWVMVLMDDNEVPQEIILEEGEDFTFYAKEKFLVTLGNAGGVYMSLNGEALDSFGKSGQVVRNILLMAKDKKKIAFLL